MRAILTLLLCTPFVSCMGLTERMTSFTDGVNTSFQSFADEQEARRTEFQESAESRQEEFESKVVVLNEVTDAKIEELDEQDSNHSQDVEVLESQFLAKVQVWMEELRDEQEEALDDFKEGELKSVKDLVDDGKDALTDFGTGVLKDIEKLKKDGLDVVVNAGRTAAGVLGYGPIVDLLSTLFGGAGVGALGLNHHRNKQRAKHGGAYVPGINSVKDSARPGEEA